MRLPLSCPIVVAAVLAAGLLLPTAGAAAATPVTAVHPKPQHLTVTSVSNPHPDLISGEQALLRISATGDARSRLRVTANGRPVTTAFRMQPDGTALGLVTGLRQGRNEIAVSSGQERARLTLDDHPISGPVFSGKQQQPFYCETTAYGLAPAVQPLCSAPTIVSYQYRTTAGAFVALPDPSARPADLAVAEVNGHPVPYIVRVETGTIDRAVYQTAALYDGRAPSPYRPDSGWNDKLVYTFGGGCNGGYHQGNATGGVLNDLFLSQGYAVASSSLNVLDNNCSTIISAEAAMMVKEHFIDTYGPVLHTIGWGGSGGAIQQYDIADAYPGILDGIVPGVSFPDPLTVLGPVTDCRLLNTFFDGSGSAIGAAAQLAVEGFPTTDTCRSWDATFASRATATESCNAAIPVSAIWNPVTNPNGIKCSANEQLVNQFGRDPKTGFVRSTLDNTGVQYGLAALKSGQLTPAEFAQLNASIGGEDYTGTPTAQRTVADPKALRAAYADDLVNSASLGLRTTPIVDQRTDLDGAGFGNDIHTTQWSFIMRARLTAANGTAANQVIIENQPTPGSDRCSERLRVGRHGSVAHRHRRRSFVEHRAAQGDRRQAGRAGRRLLPDRKPTLGAAVDLSGLRSVRCDLSDRGGHPPRGGRVNAGERAEMPAPAVELCRLPAGDVHRCRESRAPIGFPARRLRLSSTRRRSTTSDRNLDQLQRSRRR